MSLGIKLKRALTYEIKWDTNSAARTLKNMPNRQYLTG